MSLFLHLFRISLGDKMSKAEVLKKKDIKSDSHLEDCLEKGVFKPYAHYGSCCWVDIALPNLGKI